MFGYVKPFKPELKMREFDTYKAVYCGLCKQLHRSYGFWSRMTLNYDFTFLALLAMAMEEPSALFAKQTCVSNPLKRKACCLSNPQLEFAAAVAMLMLYYKIKDNCTDSKLGGKIFWYFLLPFAKRVYRKALRRADLAALDEEIRQDMEKLSQLEAQRCPHTDQAAEPSAHSLSRIFQALSTDPIKKRILERMGYLLGRWIYCIDALDDLEEDRQKGNYNPFLLHGCPDLSNLRPETLQEIRQQAVYSLNCTAAEIAAAYELLDLCHFKPILDNIIHLGLRDTMRQILLKEEKAHDRSL